MRININNTYCKPIEIGCKPIKLITCICPIDGKEFTGDPSKISPLTLQMQCTEYTNKLEEQIKIESKWNYKLRRMIKLRKKKEYHCEDCKNCCPFVDENNMGNCFIDMHEIDTEKDICLQFKLEKNTSIY